MKFIEALIKDLRIQNIIIFILLSVILLISLSVSSQVTKEWVARYDCPGSGERDIKAMTMDSSGNVYITGAQNPYSSPDYFTVKYNNSGGEQWVATYNAPGNYEDSANAIAVDSSGNVYVTGVSYSLATAWDYATVKYNSNGIEQWVVRYIGPGDSYDGANAITVDSSGNIYVTGESYGSGTGTDYATIKYNSSGIEQWVARYNGPASGNDGAKAIVIDSSRNVYVTGSSEALGVPDYATIKYNNTGIEQWVARYNGPGNDSDEAYDIAIDNSGNVYVTGMSVGSGTGIDYATVKYNNNGVEQWATRYNGTGNNVDQAEAIALDGSGNVYVTGFSDGIDYFEDYATIKYNNAGIEQWATRYDGPDKNSDRAKAIVVSGSGNVYVTGYSYGSGSSEDYATVKYNTLGVEQWVSRYNSPNNYSDQPKAIALDSLGNIYITGNNYSSGGDNTTIKFNNSGVQQWIAIYDGPGTSPAWANAITIDNSGNVCVTGCSYESKSDGDYLTIKYNNGGGVRWMAKYNGSGSGDDDAYAIVADNSGNIYITGWSEGSGSGDDYATIKYNSSGVQQWASRYNGTANDDDTGEALTIDGSGNVYVTGGSKGSGTERDCTTIKYNSGGIQQWVGRYNGPVNNQDWGYGIALDGSGNVYVTGESIGSGTDYDYITIKYNSSGTQQWATRYNGTGNDVDSAYAIAVSSSGNVYVTGESKGTNNFYDYVTIKYNNSGVEQWASRYDGTANNDDTAYAIALDGSGNVYVTGESKGSGTDYDYVTIKYNNSGVQQWVARYNGPGNSIDTAYSIALDSFGNVYITGESIGSGTDYDYATIKYSNSGIEQWVTRYNSPGNSWDDAYDIAVDNSGNVYVTGESKNARDYGDYLTIKYSQNTFSDLFYVY